MASPQEDNRNSASAGNIPLPFEAILQSVADGITVQTANGALVYANAAAADLVGFPTPEAMLAAPVSQIMADFDLFDEAGQPVPLTELPGRRALLGEPAEALIQFRRRSTGEDRWSMVRARPIVDDSGKVILAINAFQDVTAIEHAVRIRDEFLSLAAHELRTPVTSLRLTAQALARILERTGSIPPDRLGQSLQVMTDQTDRLTRLVVQLLDTARIDTGKIVLSRETVDLGALVERVARECAERQSGVTVDIVAPAVHSNIDPLRIEQVVTNLVENALKFTPAGKAIRVKVAPDDSGGATIIVADQGPGVAPEHRERIFERFFQTAASEHRAGLGLGLYLSRQIVEHHGGTLTATFPETGGSRFIVHLPAPVAEPASEA